MTACADIAGKVMTVPSLLVPPIAASRRLRPQECAVA
jgi:hypothetical protein